jgi:DNA repair photolyase
MTTFSRLAKLEKTCPLKVTVNPYAAMTDNELLREIKRMLESGAPESPEQKELARILANNGIEWTVKL